MNNEVKIFKDKLRFGVCDGVHCNENTPATDLHTCPFAEDVHDDRRFLCNCCELCTTECANDI